MCGRRLGKNFLTQLQLFLAKKLAMNSLEKLSAGARVRFGSEADICIAIGHVRFRPEATLEAIFCNVRWEPKADIDEKVRRKKERSQTIFPKSNPCSLANCPKVKATRAVPASGRANSGAPQRRVHSPMDRPSHGSNQIASAACQIDPACPKVCHPASTCKYVPAKHRNCRGLGSEAARCKWPMVSPAQKYQLQPALRSGCFRSPDAHRLAPAHRS